MQEDIGTDPVAPSKERGASLVEYALLVALIALVCMVAIVYLGVEGREAFSDIGKSISEA